MKRPLNALGDIYFSDLKQLDKAGIVLSGSLKLNPGDTPHSTTLAGLSTNLKIRRGHRTAHLVTTRTPKLSMHGMSWDLHFENETE
jgi:hypothetical protein